MTTARIIAKSVTLLSAHCVPAALLAQSAPQEVPREESAFVEQAPEDNSSKVYFPEAITPESVAAARARAAARQRQAGGVPVRCVSSPALTTVGL